MFGLSMIQLTRRSSQKFDREMRQRLVRLYRPFRWIPCFLHRPVENLFKKTKRFPVIIEFEQGEAFNSGLKDVHSTVKRKMGSKLKNKYASVSCCSAKLTASVIEQLVYNCPHIKKIHYDREMTALLDVASPSLNADTLKKAGLTGDGVTIAVIDTGIYPHDDLKGRIVGFKDFIKDKTVPYDDNGHGTHCAGDAAGNGLLSSGRYEAPAPDADLIGVKVLNKMGSGSLSTVMAGIEWCIENKTEYGINILSMSLGSPAQQSAEDDPVVKSVEKAWENGIVVCVAAGNDGPDKQTIASPGISPKVITVGATNDQNTVDRSDDVAADFSSRGPTIDGLMKPDLLTPGVNIISLRSPRSFLDKTMRSNRVDSNYFSLSGTSMATPICAGVAAQLLQDELDLTPDDVKKRLISASEDIGYPPYVQGNGYLNASKTVDSPAE
jgi:serine protease AprX